MYYYFKDPIGGSTVAQCLALLPLDPWFKTWPGYHLHGLCMFSPVLTWGSSW